MRSLEKQIEDFELQYPKNGFFVFDLLNTKPLQEARKALEVELRRMSKDPNATLEGYQRLFEVDGAHTDAQIHMTEFFRKGRFGPAIAAGQLQFFERIIGRDLKVQRNPYLRITRPRKPQDNIGFHRDTFYGGSPHELSFLVPFVDLPAESSLRLLSGSHETPEDHFRFTQVTSPEVTKGSAKHQLGFLYAPKMMDPEQTRDAIAVPLKFGQALIFSLSLVHGSEVNTGPHCRWSSDIRVMSGLAPVDLSSRPDYYETLAVSPVTASADRYARAQIKTTAAC